MPFLREGLRAGPGLYMTPETAATAFCVAWTRMKGIAKKK